MNNIEMALSSMRSGDLGAAEKYLKEDLREKGENADAFSLLAVVAHQGGNLSTAITYTMKALLLDEGHRISRANIKKLVQYHKDECLKVARQFRAEERISDAMYIFRLVAEYFPESLNAQVSIGDWGNDNAGFISHFPYSPRASFSIKPSSGLRQPFTYRGGDTFHVETASGIFPVKFNDKNKQFSSVTETDPHKFYEPEILTLIDEFLPEDGTMYDIGANWGHISIFAATRPGFSGSVFAFEPDAETYQDLSSVVQQAGLQSKIHCLRVAASDRAGEASIYRANNNHSGLTRLTSEGNSLIAGVEWMKSGSCTTCRVDDVHGTGRVDLIKIDAEDHELEVLSGATRTIERDQPFVIMENWISVDKSETTIAPLKLLSSYGYVPFVPVWSGLDRRTGGIYYSLLRSRVKDPDAAFHLFSIDENTRFSLWPAVNIFAAHRSRISDVAVKAFS
ncbi:FkbM family methyltransferase [Azospirillum sp. YIM B02556]|uniref:FkbM family methyltransferase n=1 Tax=Azospirillum endophyticum TaxID=2800326 RepID=A0ABS1F9P9_9PROT|nr:FkbM family methyltransferase [Azospirillum endophyticum]MBK1840131.1 FkbM family methyltransferase [Azospirillum endophyticum]